MYNKNRLHSLSIQNSFVSHLIWLCMYLLYFSQCNASFQYIINGCQFNFLSKQLSVITHRKKWLILMKSHRQVSYILLCYKPHCTGCVWPVWLCHFGLSSLLYYRRITFILSAVCVLCVHLGALARATGTLLVFLRRPSGLYTPQVCVRTPVACQRTEVVCVPLKVDTFQIV